MARTPYNALAAGVSMILFVATSLELGAADGVTLHAARSSITANELEQHVDALSDDTFEGREAGSRGGRAAGGYLVKLLQEYKLRGAGDNGSFYQSFGAGYRNILAVQEGSDPELKEQVVLVGAHYDHVGYGNSTNSYGPLGYIHNGADDNASGTAGLLEVIEAFSQLPEPPKRTVLFAFWDGEEKGLLGSEYWVGHPTVPLTNVGAAINLDMIGRLRRQRLEVYGSRTAPGWRRFISEQNSESPLALDFTWEMTPNSDHYTFFNKNIPVLMLHTGLHDDYHRPSDDADKVNSEGMQEVARLLFNLTYALAEAPQLGGFRTASRTETPLSQRQFEQPLAPMPPRLGVRWSLTDGPIDGLELVQVVPNSAADQAGLRAGDRLLTLNGAPITDAEQFGAQIVTAPPEIELTVERKGEENPLPLKVALGGAPVRVGVNWRSDKAEPGAVMLTRVVPGSPAAKAGLAVRDRIYAVEGQPFTDADQLGQLLTTLPSPIKLVIERDGRLSNLELEVPPPAMAEGE
ncbi:MAG: M20/M25/M40 family metallo-hydrolase [Pirellulaceae bacterium]